MNSNCGARALYIGGSPQNFDPSNIIVEVVVINIINVINSRMLVYILKDYFRMLHRLRYPLLGLAKSISLFAMHFTAFFSFL